MAHHHHSDGALRGADRGPKPSRSRESLPDPGCLLGAVRFAGTLCLIYLLPRAELDLIVGYPVIAALSIWPAVPHSRRLIAIVVTVASVLACAGARTGLPPVGLLIDHREEGLAER